MANLQIPEVDLLRLQNIDLKMQYLVAQHQLKVKEYTDLYEKTLRHNGIEPDKVVGFDINNGVLTLKEEDKNATANSK